MHTNDLSFIQIKTKRSPTCHALESITQQKLKPFYNTVYQLLHLKNPKHPAYRQIAFQIEQKIKKILPKVVQQRRINQETLQFKIKKPLQIKNFFSQTKSTKFKKCKSVTKSFSLTKQEYYKHVQKDEFGQKFDNFRKLSKTLSQSTLKNKKKYNALDKCNKLINHHFDNLQLNPRFIGGVIDQKDIKFQQVRFKMQSNKWLENVMISNDQEAQSLIRRQKTKYLMKKGDQLYAYKGIQKKTIQECQQIISQDQELMSFSLSHKIDTTNPNQVKMMHQKTQLLLDQLLSRYKTSRTLSPQNLSPRKRSIQTSPVTKRTLTKTSSTRQYKQFKQNQNQNPQNYKPGDRYSNFRSREQKKSFINRLTQHQKLKIAAKNMVSSRHRKLFLKEK